jgi:hypothetical protein
VSETTIKLVTWYFTNKATIDQVKDDQYVQELETRVKDLVKVASHVWANPDVKKLWASLREALDIGNTADVPLFTADTQKGAHGVNPLHAKGDLR